MARYRSGQPANRSKTVKKRTAASRTPQARSYKRPSRMVEQGAGMGNVLRGAARIVGAGGKTRAAAGKPKPNTGSRTAKKQTAAKKTTGRKPAQKDVLTRGEQAQKRAEQAASRARKKGDIKGSMKSSAEAAKRGAADTKRARAAKARRDKAQKRPGRIAAGTAAGVGFGGAAGGAVIIKAGQKPKPKRFRK